MVIDIASIARNINVDLRHLANGFFEREKIMFIWCYLRRQKNNRLAVTEIAVRGHLDQLLSGRSLNPSEDIT